ncbi:SDR family oxidoreductase [Paenibacillus sp. PL2-23]|uniref:dTDP-4-dehydrorhamnose reductase family protein n=1 Tax=Paenibacillus sp. PL2-23 TaxID=2100729 RepID=UPI0030F76172
MSRVVVLGAGGMAGHMLVQYLTERGHDVTAVKRRGTDSPLNTRQVHLDLRDHDRLLAALSQLRPDTVVNAAGILNDAAAERAEEARLINSLLPHRLAEWGDKLGYRLIHISTDCVFSGQDGPYNETAEPDGTSAYAVSKSLGEVMQAGHLTIRTSIIGPELKRDGIGLFHWFMMQEGKLSGYSRVYWNGVTTLELASFVDRMLANPLDGIVHLSASERVSKHELLMLFREAFRNGHHVDIEPCDKLQHDKSLLNTRSDMAPYPVPDYPEMLRRLAEWMKDHEELYAQYRLDGIAGKASDRRSLD